MGGIQSYLWELWRRLPPSEVTVLTTPYPGSEEFDAQQAYRVVRTRSPVLLPTPAVRAEIGRVAEEVGARLVVLDPALPLGLVGPHLPVPYAVVVHGAEVSVPARLPITAALLGRVLRHAAHVIAAGDWVRQECERVVGHPLRATVVPPGVDVDRFHLATSEQREAARRCAGIGPDRLLVFSVSRLVPRKGMDILIGAAELLSREIPELEVVIAGSGRDEARLRKLVASTPARVRLLGRVSEDEKVELMAAADVFALPCRRRWAGLEQEGFGIVFVEAAACAVPQVGGRSGGSAEAVVHGETGLVVDQPDDPGAVAAALGRLLHDDEGRALMGAAARRRATEELDYDLLASRLGKALAGLQ